MGGSLEFSILFRNVQCLRTERWRWTWCVGGVWAFGVVHDTYVEVGSKSRGSALPSTCGSELSIDALSKKKYIYTFCALLEDREQRQRTVWHPFLCSFVYGVWCLSL